MRGATSIVGSLAAAPSHEEIVAITRGIAGRKGEDCATLLAQHTSSGRLNRKVTNRAHALKHRYRRRWISDQQQQLLGSVDLLRGMWTLLHSEVAAAVSPARRHCHLPPSTHIPPPHSPPPPQLGVQRHPGDDIIFEQDGALQLGGMRLQLDGTGSPDPAGRRSGDKPLIEIIRTSLRTMAASVAAEAVVGATLTSTSHGYSHVSLGDAPAPSQVMTQGGLLAWVQANPTSIASMMLLPPATLDAAPSLTDKMHMLSALGTTVLLDALSAFLPALPQVDPTTPTVEPGQLRAIMALHGNAQLDVSSVQRAMYPHAQSMPQSAAAAAATAGVPVPGVGQYVPAFVSAPQHTMAMRGPTITPVPFVTHGSAFPPMSAAFGTPSSNLTTPSSAFLHGRPGSAAYPSSVADSASLRSASWQQLGGSKRRTPSPSNHALPWQQEFGTPLAPTAKRVCAQPPHGAISLLADCAGKLPARDTSMDAGRVSTAGSTSSVGPSPLMPPAAQLPVLSRHAPPPRLPRAAVLGTMGAAVLGGSAYMGCAAATTAPSKPSMWVVTASKPREGKVTVPSWAAAHSACTV